MTKPIDLAQAAAEAKAIFEAGKGMFELPDSFDGDAMEMASGLMARGDYMEALEVFAALMLMRPQKADSFIGAAVCFLELGEPLKALDCTNMAALLDPEDPMGSYLSGKAYWMIRDAETALEDLEEAIFFADLAGNTKVLNAAKRLTDIILATQAK